MGEINDGERIAILETDMAHIKKTLDGHIESHTSGGQYKTTTTIAVILLIMQSINFIWNVYDRSSKGPSTQIGVERKYQGDDK
jgi:hypothetical protein